MAFLFEMYFTKVKTLKIIKSASFLLAEKKYNVKKLAVHTCERKGDLIWRSL